MLLGTVQGQETNVRRCQRDTFLPLRDFNQQNPCLSPNYASYADYQAAAARDFGLNQLDVNLYTEANTNAWDAYCPGVPMQHGKPGTVS